jgi:AhpD family alkylhydroperoxidase
MNFGHDALTDKPGNLTKAERDIIVVTTSYAYQCQHCVVAHGAILRIRAKDPLIADQVAMNYKADITERQSAMLDFAMKVSAEAYAVGDANFAALNAHGSATKTFGTSPPPRRYWHVEPAGKCHQHAAERRIPSTRSRRIADAGRRDVRVGTSYLVEYQR